MFLSGTVDERSEKKTYSLKEVFSALKEEEEVVDEKLDTIDNNEEDK